MKTIDSLFKVIEAIGAITFNFLTCAILSQSRFIERCESTSERDVMELNELPESELILSGLEDLYADVMNIDLFSCGSATCKSDNQLKNLQWLEHGVNC